MTLRFCSILLIPLLALIVAIFLEGGGGGGGRTGAPPPPSSFVVIREDPIIMNDDDDIIPTSTTTTTTTTTNTDIITSYVRNKWWFRLLTNIVFDGYYQNQRDVTKDEILTLFFEQKESKSSSSSSSVQLIRRGDTQHRIMKIVGNTTLDVITGLGYAHARDRLVQMILLRSVAMGRLSQDWIDTPTTRRLDLSMKVDHQFNQIAKDALELLDFDTLERLKAYSKGVNNYLSIVENLPLEFDILNFPLHKIGPWTPESSLLSMHIMTVMGLHDVHILIEKFIIQVLHYDGNNEQVVKDSNNKDSKEEIGLDIKLQQIFDPFLESLSTHPNILTYIKSLRDTGRSVFSDDLLTKLEGKEKETETPPPPQDNVKSVDDSSPIGEAGLGSNAWVISGRHSQSGKPILCADPHLEISRIPPIWYQVELVVLDNKANNDNNDDDGILTWLFGITMPGLPAIVMGQRKNELSVAFTYGFGDYFDFWIEEIRNGQYRKNSDGVFVDLDIKLETIQPKNNDDDGGGGGGNNVTVVTFWTEHGKIDLKDDPMLPEESMSKQQLQHLLPDGYYLSKSSVIEGRHIATGLNSIWKITEQSQTVMEAADHCAKVFMSANFVLADGHGNIGYQQSGIHPRRTKENSGLLPHPAWESKHQWQGLIESHELVRVINPPSGIIASANNDVMDMIEEEGEIMEGDLDADINNEKAFPRTLNVHMGPYRRDRILELLSPPTPSTTSTKHTMDSMKVIQTDTAAPTKTREWIMERARPTMERHVASSSSAAALQSWDGRFDADSKGAVVYDTIYHEILDSIYGDGAFGNDIWRFIKDETQLVNMLQSTFDRQFMAKVSTNNQDNSFNDNGGWRMKHLLNQQEWMEQLVSKVFAKLDGSTLDTTEGTTEKRNSKTTSLLQSWGNMNQYYFNNILFQGQFPFAHLLGYSVGPFPFVGGVGVVWQGTSRIHRGLAKVVGPSWRYISDLGNSTVATALPGGPSGNRWDGVLYSSGMEDIVDGTYHHFHLP